MTKDELREKLLIGATLDELLCFRSGQDCDIFKTAEFVSGDEIIYIPDIDLNQLPISIDLSHDNSMMDEMRCGWGPMTAEEQIRIVLSYCYTGNDFIKECEGDAEKAERLFWYCDWQHPSSALPEIDDDEEE